MNNEVFDNVVQYIRNYYEELKTVKQDKLDVLEDTRAPFAITYQDGLNGYDEVALKANNLIDPIKNMEHDCDVANIAEEEFFNFIQSHSSADKVFYTDITLSGKHLSDDFVKKGNSNTEVVFPSVEVKDEAGQVAINPIINGNVVPVIDFSNKTIAQQVQMINIYFERLCSINNVNIEDVCSEIERQINMNIGNNRNI